MRLKLKYEKIKNCFIMLAYTCFISFACFCLLSLNVHAASSSSYTSFPLPISNVFSFTDDELALFDTTIQNHIRSLSSPYNGYWNADYVVFVRDFSNEGSYSIRAVNMPKVYFSNNNMSGWWSGSSYFYFKSTASSWGGSIDFIYNKNTGLVQNVTHSFDYSSSYTYGQKYISSTLSSNGAIITNQTYYPIYLKNATDLVLGNNPVVIFTIPSSGGFDGPGFITGEGTGTLDSDSGDLSIDFNLQYDDSAIQDKLDTIIENQEDSLDKQDTTNNWLGRIWQAITDYFTPPTQQEVTTALQGFPVFNDLTNTIGNTKTTVNSIFDFSQIQPKTADNVDFDYDFHWKVYDPSTHSFVTKTTTVHIVFSWFESVRTPVTLVLSVFLTLGFLIYIFRQIPNLINGVGGGASAGMSVAEHMKGSDKK